MYVNVVFPIPQNQHFTYSIPIEFQDAVQPGSRALVSFLKETRTGYIIGLCDNPPSGIKIKPIIDLLDTTPVMSGSLLNLARWVSEYYMCSLGEAIRAFLPAGMQKQSKKFLELADEIELKYLSIIQRKIITTVRQYENIQLSSLKKIIGTKAIYYNVARLVEAGAIRLVEKLVGQKDYIRKEKFVKLASNPESVDLEKLARRSPKQAEMLRVLKECGGVEQLTVLCKLANCSSQIARGLEKKALIEIFDRVIMQDYYGDLNVPQATRLVLNAEQKRAVSQINQSILARENKTFLLLGVTGSGKTQVYIEVMRQALEMGKGAIVMVPEIALTPQTVSRFRSEFQNEVTVIHSRMSQSERYFAWSLVREGKCRVVVGPRSAVFAPIKNLGLIVVDEEHDTSYKQSENSPRYHGRDLAVVRGVSENAVVILGSATPSLESFHNAQTGKYALVELKKRIDDIPLPKVTVVDLARQRLAGTRKSDVIISRLLMQKIAEKLERNEQVILLQNRRGFSTTVQCSHCGEVSACPNCNISLSYHRQGNIMRCHYCNFAQKLPDRCGACQRTSLLHRGVGTQQVQEFLHDHFKDARIVRMDQDTTRRKYAHDKILTDFGNHKYDILLGTQMIAKGLDFEKVTLVGVISADTGLFLPDFRANERTFQLLTQVAGRAGRKNGQGEVIIQTLVPQHPCLQLSRTHDYYKFAAMEFAERRSLQYPPGGRLVLLHFIDENENRALQAARKFAFLLTELRRPFKIVGPAPAALSKLKNRYRFHLVIKGNKRTDPGAKIVREAIKKCLQVFAADGSDLNRVQIRVDIDPMLIL
ncbi:primosomal protein N' [candidate division KSB1 bacterium]|nr:primosomal protein N' [candidate division KSB1 bacterium]